MSDNFITVGTNAKKAALVWLHEVQEHEDLLRKSISEWPEKTYQLAVHIQQAIGQACAQKDQEIALLKEQIRVADVAFQGLFNSSAEKDQEIARLKAAPLTISTPMTSRILGADRRIAELEQAHTHSELAHEQKNQRIAELEASRKELEATICNREGDLIGHEEIITDYQQEVKKKDLRITELEEKQKGYTTFAFATGEAAAKRELRITELEKEVADFKANNRYQRGYHDGEQSVSKDPKFLPNAREIIANKDRKIEELEKEAALLTIQLTSITETKNIIEERIRQLETQLEEHGDQNNQLVRAYANLQQAAFKLGDQNKAMAELLDHAPHKRERPSEPDCAPDCPACKWAKLKSL